MEKHVDVLYGKSSPTSIALDFFVGGPVQNFVYLKDIVPHVDGEVEFSCAPCMNQYAGL